MHHCLELTPDGRLLARQQTETPEGLREKVTDVTAHAHHRLDDTVVIQAGTRLSAIFELLMANAALKDIYTRNWVHDYVARYEAIRSGEAVPAERERADPQEPAMQALVLSQHQEVRLPRGLLVQIATAQEAPAESRRGLLNLLPGGAGHQGDSAAHRHTVKESSSYWHLSGRSVPFTQDTELWGVTYKAGSHIDYSVSFSFDRCIDLPLSIGAGVLTLDLVGKSRKDRLTVQLPLGTDHEPPTITLHELISAITHDFSFHGGPQETQAAGDDLRQTVAELDDERNAENLSYGMPHMVCPDDAFHLREAHAQELQNRARYWDRALVIEHTGWAEAELKSRRNQGRLLELRAPATTTTPHRKAYPAEQFMPGFDTELFRFLNWLASRSCSDWATHQFLLGWTTPHKQDEAINGWSVLALPDAPLDHAHLTDLVFTGVGNRSALTRPVYAPHTPKLALVNAFEAFAAQRRRDYEQRDELEDDA